MGDTVKASQPSSVMPTVCSNWAERDRSRVTAVQPSDSILTCGLPRLIIGSMVNSIPGFSCDAFARLAVMQDIRAVVKNLPQTVTAKIAHDAAALPFGIGLDGRADVAGRAAGPGRRDAAHQ